MRKGLFFLGLVTTLFGLFGMITSAKFTGFVISESLDIGISIPNAIILIVLGVLLMTTSKDSLQQWFERKEKESPSPSLEGKLQTEKEAKHFAKRHSETKPSIWQKLFGHYVEKVPQKPQPNLEYIEVGDTRRHFLTPEEKEIMKKNEGGSHLSESEKQQMIGQELALREEQAKLLTCIPDVRKKLMDVKKMIDSKHWKINAKDWENYMGNAEFLTKAYETLKMPIRNRTEMMVKESAIKTILTDLEELKINISENKKPFSPIPTQIELRRLYEIRSGTKVKTDLPTMSELEDMYYRDTKTVSIREASDRYGVKITHGIPILAKERGDRRSGDSGISHLTWDHTLHDFLEIITNKKPMLSASSTSTYNGRIGWATGEIGVILKDGKIFDASPKDVGSQADLETGRRYTNDRDMRDDDPIDWRVEKTIVHGNSDSRFGHNELIVGDYELGAIYYVEENIGHYPDGKNIVKQAAQEAINRKLPFLRYYKEGDNYAFQEVNPRDYLEEKPDTRKAPTKTASKTTKRRTREPTIA